MEFISQWFEGNLDIVFFIYGLAFVLMGIAILVQPRKGSEFRLAGIIWLLAMFGLTHGTNELLDMWMIIKGRNPGLDTLRWFILVISYYFLFEFGRKLFSIETNNTANWQKIGISLFPRWGIPVSAIAIIVAGFLSSDSWAVGSTLSRYFLCFPAGFLIGAGFYLNYKNDEEILRPLKVKRHFMTLGIVFVIYGVLGGLVVPKADFFPASVINNGSFLSFTGFPVQVVRAVCAIVAAWATGGILSIFNWEMRYKFTESEKKLKLKLRESEDKYAEVVNDSSDMFIFIDIDGFITFANKQALGCLGYSEGELIDRHVKDIYDPDTWEEVEAGLKKLNREGALFIDNGKMRSKDGKKLDVETHSMAIYDREQSLSGARLSIRDISERIMLEKELKSKIKDLQEFYDVAMESEMRMIKLKGEIKKLNRELGRDSSG